MMDKGKVWCRAELSGYQNAITKRKIDFGEAWGKLFRVINVFFFTKRKLDLSAEETQKTNLDL